MYDNDTASFTIARESANRLHIICAHIHVLYGMHHVCVNIPGMRIALECLPEVPKLLGINIF